MDKTSDFLVPTFIFIMFNHFQSIFEDGTGIILSRLKIGFIRMGWCSLHMARIRFLCVLKSIFLDGIFSKHNIYISKHSMQ